MICADMRIQ